MGSGNTCISWTGETLTELCGTSGQGTEIVSPGWLKSKAVMFIPDSLLDTWTLRSGTLLDLSVEH